MKFYQCRNTQKYFYTMIFIYTFTMLFLGIAGLGDFKFISGGRMEKIVGGVIFTILGLIGIRAYIHDRMIERSKRTVEVNSEGVEYQSKNETIKFEWIDIEKIYLFPMFFCLAYDRIIYFVVDDSKFQFQRGMKVSNNVIWSEYNDFMLEEVKKYWKYDIVNEDKYIEYKNKRKRHNR